MTSVLRIRNQLHELLGRELSDKYRSKIDEFFSDLSDEFGLIDMILSKSKRDIVLSEIENAIIEEFGTTFKELKSNSRARILCLPRQFAMCLMRDNHLVLSDIGSVFNKDHATVIHAHRKIHELSSVDKQFRKQYERLKENSDRGIQSRLAIVQNPLEFNRRSDGDGHDQIEATKEITERIASPTAVEA